MQVNNIMRDWGYSDDLKFVGLMPKVSEKIGEVGSELKVPDFWGLMSESGSTSDSGSTSESGSTTESGSTIESGVTEN